MEISPCLIIIIVLISYSLLGNKYQSKIKLLMKQNTLMITSLLIIFVVWIHIYKSDTTKLFNKIDTNKSGEIKKEELSKLFHKCKGINKKEIDKLHHILDADNSDSISNNEFQNKKSNLLAILIELLL